MHFIYPVTKVAGNSLLKILHSERVVAEGSLASSLLSQAAPRNLHTYPGQHTHCYTLHLYDPEDVYQMAVQCFPRSAWEVREAERSSAQGKLLKLFLPWQV